jgi:hypothetical protein
MYTIYTERIGGNGSTYRNEFECKSYNITNGYIECWNPELTRHHFISIHKMDHITIVDSNNKNIKEKEDEIKCIT